MRARSLTQCFVSCVRLRGWRRGVVRQSFASPVQQLQQRTWLLHWSLFVFFNHETNRTALLEYFLHEKYLNVIQTSCPHLLRYLAAAAILAPAARRTTLLPEVVALIEHELYTFRDPLTEFLRLLFVEFDFDAAQTQLQEFEKVGPRLCRFSALSPVCFPPAVGLGFVPPPHGLQLGRH